MADEATGNLDSATTDEILALFARLNDEGKTIIMITHEDEVAAKTKRVLRLRDGLIESDERNRPRSGHANVEGIVSMASAVATV